MIPQLRSHRVAVEVIIIRSHIDNCLDAERMTLPIACPLWFRSRASLPSSPPADHRCDQSNSISWFQSTFASIVTFRCFGISSLPSPYFHQNLINFSRNQTPRIHSFIPDVHIETLQCFDAIFLRCVFGGRSDVPIKSGLLSTKPLTAVQTIIWR